MNRLRSERGQATVLTVIFLVALLGVVALVLDVGSWFREQRDTQSAADAAALAAAQALPESTGRRRRSPTSTSPRTAAATPRVTFTSKYVPTTRSPSR